MFLKRISILCCCVLVFLFSGCSHSNQTQESKGEETKHEVQAAQNVNSEGYVQNPQVSDDRLLQKVGESVTDDKGKLTLKYAKDLHLKKKIGPVELTINEIKVMKYRPSYSLIDFFHSYTHDEEFDMIKVNVVINNTDNQEIKFNPIAYLTMGDMQKNWEDDFYLEELNTGLKGKEEKSGNFGFILNEKMKKQLKLLTSDVVDEKNNVITKGKEIVINM